MRSCSRPAQQPDCLLPLNALYIAATALSIPQALAEARAALAAQQEHVSALQAEKKAMDRALKREFHEADSAAMAKLVQLYKQCLAAPAAAAGGGGAAAGAAAAAASSPGPALPALWQAVLAQSANLGSGAGPLSLGGVQQRGVEVPHPGEGARPEGLDPLVWDRFVDYRARRGRLELAARDEESKAARAGRQVAVLEAEAAALSEAAASAESEAAALRAARRAACEDVELRFTLKAGQVEAEPKGLGALLEGAVMVKRDMVDGLNEVVRSKGRQKMELLGQIKDFKKGIYALQWENKKWVLGLVGLWVRGGCGAWCGGGVGAVGGGPGGGAVGRR